MNYFNCFTFLLCHRFPLSHLIYLLLLYFHWLFPASMAFGVLSTLFRIPVAPNTLNQNSLSCQPKGSSPPSPRILVLSRLSFKWKINIMILFDRSRGLHLNLNKACLDGMSIWILKKMLRMYYNKWAFKAGKMVQGENIVSKIIIWVSCFQTSLHYIQYYRLAWKRTKMTSM